MAGSVNKVILIGNLGADPEIRQTKNGKPIANLRIATTENWRDKQTGERQERTEWHRVVIFSEPTCRFVEQYLKKGAKVYIEGQLQTRKWQDQSGQDRYSTEVVVQAYTGTLTSLDSRGGGQGQSSGGDYNNNQSSYGSGGGQGGGNYGDQPSFGQGGGDSNQQGGTSSGGDKPVSFEKELDDEIPF